MASNKKSAPRRIALIVVGFFSVALTVLLIDVIVDIWPAVGVQSEHCKAAEKMPLAERDAFLETMRKGYKVNCRFKDVAVTRVNLGGTHTFLSPGQGMFALVGIFAFLGALVRSLRSVVWAGAGWGEEDFSVLWSLLRPIVAAGVAILIYVILRALFLPSGLQISANPFGFLAIAMIVGLFCEEVFGGLLNRAKALAGKS